MLKHLFTNDKPGFYQGKHYTAYVDEVKALRRDEQRSAEAEALLLGLIAAIEAEATAYKGLMAPWYTEQLALMYRKQRRYTAEVAILERYDQAARTPTFRNRVTIAKALAATAAEQAEKQPTMGTREDERA